MINPMRYFIKLNSFILGLILLMTSSSFLSCGKQQKQLQKKEDASVLITYKKERTRGLRNPLFTIELLENKAIKYTGIANVAVIGKKLITIDRTTYNKIITSFQRAQFANFKSVYKGKMRDLPLTTIIYQEHQVTYQEAACPEKLNKLAKLMESLVDKI